jgi:type VI secretion system Hcp family effector
MKTLITCLTLAFFSHVQAALPVFLELTINGSDIAGEPGQTSVGGLDVSQMILVNAFRHEIVRSGSTVNHKGFTIVKPLDKSTPLLAQALGQNGVGTAVIRLFRNNSNDGTVEQNITYTLTNCQIIRVQPWMANVTDPAAAALPPMEEVTFTYQNIQIESETSGASAILTR